MIMILRIVHQGNAGASPSASLLRLDRHGALIGRSSHADWTLPDPQNYISSNHCEIAYRNGGYMLTDRSTNGTFVNGSPQRLTAPHRLTPGDEIVIGHYRILASIEGEEAPASPAAMHPNDAQQGADAKWSDWPTEPLDTGGWGAATPTPDLMGWGRSGGDVDRGWGKIAAEPAGDTPIWPAPAQPAISGAGPLSDHWAAPIPIESPPVSRTAPEQAAPTFGESDIWSRLAEGHQVDWGEESFAGQPQAAADVPHPSPSEPAPSQADDACWTAFLKGAGLTAEDVTGSRVAVMAAAGEALRLLLAGLLPMVDARSRAKAQMGAQNTILELDGNNPLKFVRAPERAMALLLNPPQPGFMTSQRAIEGACRDLQAHQMATLMAMKGALRAALDNFSPGAIRDRHGGSGTMAHLVPVVEDARLWRRYETEFDGAVRGSNEAFVDVFAREFRSAYENKLMDDH